MPRRRWQTVEGRLLGLVLLAGSLLSCATHVTFVNLRDGGNLTGRHQVWRQSLAVVVASGETLEGRYEALTQQAIGPGSLFFGANLSALLGAYRSERTQGYARLVGDRGTVMEIVFALEWTGRGYGVARSSDGREYAVSF